MSHSHPHPHPIYHYGHRNGLPQFALYDSATRSAITDLTALIEAFNPDRIIELTKAIDEHKQHQYQKSRARRSNNKILSKLSRRESGLAEQISSNLSLTLARNAAKRAA